MTGAETQTQMRDSTVESSHVESQGPFHRAVVERDAFCCLPAAMFDNIGSEARDHCANERTFLSWLRLSVILGVVGGAVVINFSLNSGSPSKISLKYHIPVGVLFLVASLAILAVGLINYFRTIKLYGERRAVVQVDFKVQSVAILVGCFIISFAILFIATKGTPERA